MTRFLHFSLIGLFGFCLLGCSPETDGLDPDKQPYKLEEVFQEDTFRPVDLNNDGRDERVRVIDTRLAIVLREHDGRTINQVDYTEPIKNLYYLDLNDDDILEILVPFVRNDSLLLSIVDARGNKRNQFFLTAGEPLRQEGSLIGWDPAIYEMFLVDCDADGRKELVAVIATQYARLPRGVFVYSLPNFRLLGKQIFGSMPQPGSIFVDDIDGDGRQEILLATGAPDNGAVAGDMDDEHSYLVSLDLDPSPQVKKIRKMGGLRTDAKLRVGDFNGDGEIEYLAYMLTYAGKPQTPAQLQLIDPNSLAPYKQQTFLAPLFDVAVVDLDRDTRDDILVLGISGELEMFNGRLESVMHRRMPGMPMRGGHGLHILPDIDGDGIDEVVVRIENRAVLLTPNLDVKAVFPVEGFAQGIMWQGLDRPPYLYASSGGYTHVFRLVKNPLYLLNRYIPWASWILRVGLWLVAGFLILLFYRKNRQLDETRRNILQYTQEVQQEKQRIVQLWKRLKENPETLSEEDFAVHAHDEFMTRAYQVVGNGYSDPHFNVGAFADEMGCSTRTLQREIRKKCGCSPQDFIRSFRLERAKKLIEERYGTVAEIAYAVGFGSPAHFSTRFKKAYRVSPSAYMKNLAPQDSSESS